MINRGIVFLIAACTLYSCAVNKNNYDPNKKFSPQELQQDYLLLKNILEKKHPSLYWYTSKDSMDFFFTNYYNAIIDSMTEMQFGWKILAPVISKIHCGHTSFMMSKEYNKWVVNKRHPSFPLYLKIWNDTMLVTVNLNRKDSILKKGTIIKSINGIPTQNLVKTFFDHMSQDGYSYNLNYIRLSANFPYYHRNIFGLSKNYNISFLDSLGVQKEINIPLYNPPQDTSKVRTSSILVKKSEEQIRKEKLLGKRSMIIDTAYNTALITLNTFSSGNLRSFFRQSFKEIRKKNIQNVILDLRSNGGGRMNLSTLLTKYVSRKPFKVADSSYAVTKSLRPYTKYVKNKFLNNIALFFFTHKKRDGLYHFKVWENKVHKPKKNNHFGGDLYILINGPTFSASTLFCNIIKGQERVTLIGEEAGGGWHGNSGILIPDIILPNTHLKVRLPLFRIVQYNHVPNNGQGIMPDIYVGTDYEALKKGEDKKMKIAKELIQSKYDKKLP